MNKPELSILIPCFNEQENIKIVPEELLPVLNNLHMDCEIVIVDDGSTDDSEKEILKINDPRIKLVKHPENRGLGCAVRTGIDNAQGDLLITLDADFTFSPEYIPRLLEALNANPDIDFVISTSELKDFGKIRVLVSKLARKIYSFLLGEKNVSVNQIFKLYKTQQLKDLPLKSRGFDFGAEIFFKLVFSGKKFVEVPVPLTTRIHGTSHLNYPKELTRHGILLLKIMKWKFFGFKSAKN